jgi:4-hydroxyphenylacetate 3-hydroxylase, reductase component
VREGQAVSRGPFDGSAASSALRSALGRFATGVTIVTCSDGAGAPVGLTVNSFSALSLEPPLVLWSLRVESPSLPSFRAARHFAVNVLAEAQVELSRRFASPSTHRFELGRWSAGHTGAPVLAGAVAVFECASASALEHGDHVLFIGAVRHVVVHGGAPLLFQAGRYRRLGDTL